MVSLIRRTTLFLYLHPDVARRSCWVIWGADLHFYTEYRNNRWLRLADRVIRGRVFELLEFVVALAPGDVDVLRDAYGVTKRWTLGMYINPVTAELLDAQPARTRGVGEPVRILVGNNSAPSNNHLEILNLLARFRNEQIQVLVPLSYGDKDHAELVRESGIRTLGGGFVALDEFLDPSEYAALLSTVDVAIFNHARQQALGNYFALAYLGAKIYTRMDGPSAKYLSGQMGVPLYEVATIGTVAFKDFPKMSDDERAKSRLAARTFYDPTRLRSVWEQVFSDRV